MASWATPVVSTSFMIWENYPSVHELSEQVPGDVWSHLLVFSLQQSKMLLMKFHPYTLQTNKTMRLQNSWRWTSGRRQSSSFHYLSHTQLFPTCRIRSAFWFHTSGQWKLLEPVQPKTGPPTRTCRVVFCNLSLAECYKWNNVMKFIVNKTLTEKYSLKLIWKRSLC